jgi:hypothetical protein
MMLQLPATAAAAAATSALLRQLTHAAAAGWPSLATATTTSSSSGRACYSSSAAEPMPRQPPLPRARLAGQPTPATHPELLRPNELTPGISAREYRQRRRRLAQAMPEGAVAVLPAASTTFVTGVIPYVSHAVALFGRLV